jgi:DHA1 family inner membrane transport protein
MGPVTSLNTAQPAPARTGGGLAGVGVVVALAVTAFSYVTTENLPIGLLPLIADDLGTSPSAVGLLVTGYGVTVALFSVPLTHLAQRVPRRTLLAGLLAVFVVSTVVSANAETYWLLLTARICTALSQAVFWPVVAPTAAGLFEARVRGRVIATVFAGASLAAVLGVPAGTWLGQQAGWRVAFLALSALGLVALLAVISLLPNVRAGEGHASAGTAPNARSYRVIVTTTTLTIVGVFTAYTYTVLFLTQVSGFSAREVVSVLLLQGAAGVVGVGFAGALVDRLPRVLPILTATLLAVALVGLFVFGHVPYAAAAMAALSGFALSGVPTGAQSRIMQVAPGSTEVASAWNGAAFNAGIAGGALIGGGLLSSYGVRSTALVGGLLAAGSVAVLLSEPLMARRGAGRVTARGVERPTTPGSE